MEQKIQIDIAVLEELGQAAEIMYEILSQKDLTEADVIRMKYVNKLLTSCNELFSKSIK
jgi:hypothetical protein